MLRLRMYKKSDAKAIVNWLDNKETFTLWGGELFGKYPITEDIINDKYFNHNGDCSENDNFYPMTAFDNNGPAGHFIMRYINGDNRILRFGWVIVDNSKRGMGYGKEMLLLGLKYAFEILKVSKVTLGVFENNIAAYRCYTSVGFRKVSEEYSVFNGQKRKVIELEITEEIFKNL